MTNAIETLTVYNPIGGALCTLPVTNSCDRTCTLGGDNKITLNCNFATRYTIPAFAYVRYDGELFFCKELYVPQPMGGYYHYEVSFFSVLNMLYKPLFKRYVTVDGDTFDEPEFDVNANLATIGEMLVTAVNKYSERVPLYNGQTTIFAQCIADGKFRLADNAAYNDSTLQAFSFSSMSILDAISTVAQTFETEFWCVPSSGIVPTYTLRLDKCEQGDIVILTDVFDNDTRKSGGLVSAEYASEFGTVPQVLLPIGSDRNITRKVAQQTVNGNLMNVSYAKRLKLDPNATYSWTDDNMKQKVIITTDAAGAIIIDGITTGIETTETFDDIYPKCRYRVTEVVTRGNKENPYYKVMFETVGGVAAPDFPFTIADGLTLSIVFESGLLNGMEFEVEQGDGGNGVMGLTIIPNGDDESAQIPYGSFVPKVGDEFAVFNIVMPDTYIAAAKLELAKAAYEKVCEYRDTRPDLSCQSDPNYFHANGISLGLGSRVAVESELIGALQYISRVSEFSHALTTPDDVSFKLSSSVQAGSLVALKLAIADATSSVNGLEQRSIVLSRRGWRDQKELSEMISSLASEMMLIGNEKYQFGLTSTITILNDTDSKFSAVKFTAGALEHTQPPYRDNGNGGVYEMPAATYYKANIDGYNADTPYYIYAVLNSNTAKGTWLITPTAQDGEQYMLVGVLASEFENQRTFSRTYGYTAVTGGKITTEMIQDSASNLIIDFQSNPPRIVARGGAEIVGNIRFLAADGTAKSIDEVIDDIDIGGENLYSGTNPLLLASGTNNYCYSVLLGTDSHSTDASLYLENGAEYVFSCQQTERVVGSATEYTVLLYDFVSQKSTSRFTFPIGDTPVSGSFRVPDTGYWSLLLYCGVQGATANTSICYYGLMLQKGNKRTDYQRYVKHLTDAMTKGSTDINGGLVLANVMAVRNLNGAVRGGMSGMDSDGVAFWSGGTYASAAAQVSDILNATLPFLISKDGLGKIGIFKVTDTQVIVDVPNQGKIIIDGSSTNAGIYIQDTKGNDKIVIVPRDVKSSDLPKDNNSSDSGTSTISVDGALTDGSSTTITSENTFTVRPLTTNASQTQSRTNVTISGYAQFTLTVYYSQYNMMYKSDGTADLKIKVSASLINTSSGSSIDLGSNTYERTVTKPTTGAGSQYMAVSKDFGVNSIAAGTYKLRITVTTYNGDNAASLPIYTGQKRSISGKISYSDTIVTKYAYEPRTIIAKNGLVSVWDKDSYFGVYNEASGQTIKMMGLPAAATAKGQLYQSDGTIKIRTT